MHLTRRNLPALLAGALVAPRPARAANAKIKVGCTGAPVYAPLFVALAGGYFARHGIDVEIVNMSNSYEAQPLLARGDLDCHCGIPSAGFLNGLDNYSDVKLIASMGEYPDTPMPAFSMFIRTEDAKSGRIGSVADLRGKKVAANGGSVGSGGSYYAGLFLAAGGLTLKDVEMLSLPSSPAVAIALENRQIDAGMILFEMAKPNMENGTFQQVVANAAPIMMGTAVNYAIAGRRLLKDERPLGVAFVRAMQEATREHLVQDYRQDRLVLDALVSLGHVPREWITTEPPTVFRADLAPDPAGVLRMQAMFRPLRVLQYRRDFTAADIVDSGLAKEAAAS